MLEMQRCMASLFFHKARGFHGQWLVPAWSTGPEIGVRIQVEGIKYKIYLAYMYICCRANHINFKIPFASIAEPSKEPCVLQQSSTIIRYKKRVNNTISVLSSSSTRCIYPFSEKKRAGFPESSAVFSIRTIAWILSVGSAVFGNVPRRTIEWVKGSSFKTLLKENWLRR